MTRIRNPRDFVSGLLLMGLGLAFLWLGKDFRIGTWREMGPGMFPLMLASILALLGLAMAGRALLRVGAPMTNFNAKGLVLITFATCLFGVIIRSAGLAVAVFAVVLVGAIASNHFRMMPALLLAVGLSLFCVLTFIKGLGLPIPIFGIWFG